MNKLYRAEPEIREDLQGRIEVFDQSIRSFEKRLRAIERRLSLETPSLPQAGRIFPQRSSISPESPIPGNSFLSNSVAVLSQGNISNFGLNTAIPSGDTSNIFMLTPENSSESLRSLQAALSELSNFARNDLKSEIEKLENEMKSLKAQEETATEYINKLELRIETIENQNRLTFGSIRIPIEVSGILGSSVLFLTGFLIWSDRWEVIRSPYFSAGLAVLMAGAVLTKFYIVNCRKKLPIDKK